MALDIWLQENIQLIELEEGFVSAHSQRVVYHGQGGTGQENEVAGDSLSTFIVRKHLALSLSFVLGSLARERFHPYLGKSSSCPNL